MHELNIALINTTDVGQTSFLHQIFDLPGDIASSSKPNIYTLHGVQYAVNFCLSSLQDLRYADDGQIRWPNLRDLDCAPAIHAAIVIYEVGKSDGLLPIPKLLGKFTQYYLYDFRHTTNV